jgi:hypothetical protein
MAAGGGSCRGVQRALRGSVRPPGADRLLLGGLDELRSSPTVNYSVIVNLVHVNAKPLAHPGARSAARTPAVGTTTAYRVPEP